MSPAASNTVRGSVARIVDRASRSTLPARSHPLRAPRQLPQHRRWLHSSLPGSPQSPAVHRTPPVRASPQQRQQVRQHCRPHEQLRHQLQPARRKSSTAFADLPIPESVRQRVKTSFLERATQHNSSIWADTDRNGVDDDISTLSDPLDEWHLHRDTRYWPDLPDGVLIDPASMTGSPCDPFLLTKHELDTLSESIRNDLLGTDHPVLNKAASYFFGSADGGKKVRPMMVMLLSRALADTLGKAVHTSSRPSSTTSQNDSAHKQGGTRCIESGSHNSHTQHQLPATTRKAVNGLNGHSHPTQAPALFTEPMPWQRQDLPKAQRRLAEISEMIHTASLFHDDVIDEADTRRSKAAVHTVFGNKMAILAGDYLLARASICLARLRNVEVVETMSTIIEHLVRGEVMQMRGTASSEGNDERLDYYLRKNYYKTSSLMANSCKSAALLADCPKEMVAASYQYGKFVGMAFQLVDDVLDFEGSITSLGKPALSDLNSGLATGPVLFAAEQFPELYLLMDRKFKQPGDVERATELVFRSDGIERTKQLARVHAELAMEAVLQLFPGPHRDALVHLAYKVVSRTK